MTKIDYYRRQLSQISDWEPYLIAESGLPGPRGNLELAQAVSLEGDAPLFERLVAYTPEIAPVNSPQEFLAFCGVLGLGRFLSSEAFLTWERFKQFAADPRWRTREAVAMALQAYGDRDIVDLTDKLECWANGGRYLQRAAAAALCEPRLLKNLNISGRVLAILDKITRSVVSSDDHKTESFRVLRQALGYCWSVAVAAYPSPGKSLMEYWFSSTDPDIRRIMKENLAKNRLHKVDSEWVQRWRLTLN